MGGAFDKRHAKFCLAESSQTHPLVYARGMRKQRLLGVLVPELITLFQEGHRDLRTLGDARTWSQQPSVQAPTQLPAEEHDRGSCTCSRACPDMGNCYKPCSAGNARSMSGSPFGAKRYGKVQQHTGTRTDLEGNHTDRPVLNP
jgi:hypothetical protein